MGVFDVFKKSNEKATFDSFPDLRNYRSYVFLKGGEAGELKRQMDEYHQLGSETAFSTALYTIGGTPWTYVVLTPRPNADKVSMVWDFLNILLWMSDKAASSFAYACPAKEGELPIIAYRDENNDMGDSCKGIAREKFFHASIPDFEVIWEQSLPKQFDYVDYLQQNYGIDVSRM
jgi:hypothetical protein